MSDTIDPSVLAAVKQAAEAATPGPWSEMCMGSEGYFVFEVEPSTGYKFRRRVAACTNEAWDIDKANAAYIVAACNAAPALIAEIERLTAQVEGITAGAKPCVFAESDG